MKETAESNWELRNKFLRVVWAYIGNECDTKPADAFEQALQIVFDLSEEQEIEELIRRIRRNEDARQEE